MLRDVAGDFDKLLQVDSTLPKQVRKRTTHVQKVKTLKELAATAFYCCLVWYEIVGFIWLCYYCYYYILESVETLVLQIIEILLSSLNQHMDAQRRPADEYDCGSPTKSSPTPLYDPLSGSQSANLAAPKPPAKDNVLKTYQVLFLFPLLVIVLFRLPTILVIPIEGLGEQRAYERKAR